MGTIAEHFVDTHRPTAANGGAPGHPERSLPTIVFYPAQGRAVASATENAPSDTRDGPYPLIVFGHGLGSGGAEYRGLLERWAAAGYVVAAPQFPLTHAGTAGGLDPSDYVNQPGDLSYVITAVLRASGEKSGRLAGLVDPQEIGAAGHSHGGVTTLGLAANTCCQDERVKAAIVMSGDTLTFPKGHFDYAKAPPIMFVHGTADALIPYESSVDAFNLANGPKGLVTVLGGDHGATVSASEKAFTSIVRATTDFFDGYLKHDAAATGRIESDAVAGMTRIVFDSTEGSHTTVPTTPKARVPVHHASATPTAGLANGQPVTVRWSSYTAGKSVNIVQCSKRDSTDASACDLKRAALLQPDPTGTGSATISVVAGKVGSGTCDATHPNCVIVVNDGGSLDPASNVRVPITFAPG